MKRVLIQPFVFYRNDGICSVDFADPDACKKNEWQPGKQEQPVFDWIRYKFFICRKR